MGNAGSRASRAASRPPPVATGMQTVVKKNLTQDIQPSSHHTIYTHQHTHISTRNTHHHSLCRLANRPPPAVSLSAPFFSSPPPSRIAPRRRPRLRRRAPLQDRLRHRPAARRRLRALLDPKSHQETTLKQQPAGARLGPHRRSAERRSQSIVPRPAHGFRPRVHHKRSTLDVLVRDSLWPGVPSSSPPNSAGVVAKSQNSLPPFSAWFAYPSALSSRTQSLRAPLRLPRDSHRITTALAARLPTTVHSPARVHPVRTDQDALDWIHQRRDGRAYT